MKQDIKTRFLEDTKNHQTAIELDNGVFRSIRFQRPNDSAYYFRINTWPGHLAISGDMGTYVFARTHDMFSFFRNSELKINIGYWTEKLQSISCFGSNSGNVFEYDGAETFKAIVNYLDECETEYNIDELESLKECSSVQEALRIMEDIDDSYDIVERMAEKPTFHIQWCLYAIVWGIQQYDKLQETQKAS